MREDKPFENRVKASKFSDQNQMPKVNNAKGNSLRPSWGSHIVNGFSTDKKSKLQSTVPTKKLRPPFTSSDLPNQKNPFVPSHSRVKMSPVEDLSCSVNAAQVHHINQTQPSASRDLFLELDHLRSLLHESKERETELQVELLDCKRNPKVLDLQRELELKKTAIESLVQRVGFLETEKAHLTEQLRSLTSGLDGHDDLSRREEHETRDTTDSHNLQMEVFELRRSNKEHQLQKRNLACRLSSLESQLATLVKVSENDIVAKIKAEASLLRVTNEDLSRQVEGLQMSRLNEVEELVYLRWVNTCLRNELRNCSTVNSENLSSSTNSVGRSSESVSLSSCHTEVVTECSSTKRLNLIKKLKKWPITREDLQNLECLSLCRNISSNERVSNLSDKSWVNLQSSRRHSISGLIFCAEDLMLGKQRQSDAFICTKELEQVAEPLSTSKYDLDIVQKPQIFSNLRETTKVLAFVDVERRALRVPNPPPRPSCTVSSGCKDDGPTEIPAPPLPPPPPPPPPPNFAPPPKFAAAGTTGTTGMVQRAPGVVELYHSLMKRDSRKDSLNGVICDAPDVANVRNSMIGEIENRSSHLLAIKSDIETQGEFVNFLIREVNGAVFPEIDDVVVFVKWLDDELCFLVDERAVLKHFDWPEKKADRLREAAFEYRDLKKLEYEVCNYHDDPQLPCDIALRKMVNLSEKMERTVYNLLRIRDTLMHHCKEFQIPTDWMLDTGIVSKVKFGSVKLAKKYMKRVAMELQAKGTSEKDSATDYMLLQGVRYAFRIHQFAGGFDAETMHAFEELRQLAIVLNKT